MFSESNIIKIHEYILEDWYTKNIPSKAELRSILKNNMILYSKTEW
jgi:hypothetical protein